MASSEDFGSQKIGAAADTPPPHLTLRKFGEEDFGRLISWIGSPEIMRDWAAGFFTYPLTTAQLEKYREGADQGERRLFTVVDDADGQPVGHIELGHIVPHLAGFVQRVLVGAPDRRGRGLGEQMVRCLASLAFEEYGFHHLNLGVVSTNHAAIRCYAKIGFQKVGEWPDATPTPAGRVSIAWMMLCRANWVPGLQTAETSPRYEKDQELGAEEFAAFEHEALLLEDVGDDGLAVFGG